MLAENIPMSSVNSDRVGMFWRRHPHLLICTTVLMAVLSTFVLLVNTDYNVILYKAF